MDLAIIYNYDNCMCSQALLGCHTRKHKTLQCYLPYVTDANQPPSTKSRHYDSEVVRRYMESRKEETKKKLKQQEEERERAKMEKERRLRVRRVGQC